MRFEGAGGRGRVEGGCGDHDSITFNYCAHSVDSLDHAPKRLNYLSDQPMTSAIDVVSVHLVFFASRRCHYVFIGSHLPGNMKVIF